MLNNNLQHQLATQYLPAKEAVSVKVALDESLSKALHTNQQERIADCAILFVDIAGFSKKCSSKSESEVREFLDGYYSVAISTIYNNDGRIDRIAGDGILAIFSPTLLPGIAFDACQDRCLKAAKRIVYKLTGTDYESKAAVSVGKLLFCKTGLTNIYEDFTVIGTPITLAYRLEELAKVDQVWMPDSGHLAKAIRENVQHFREKKRISMQCGKPSPHNRWHVLRVKKQIRGVGEQEIIVESLNPK